MEDEALQGLLMAWYYSGYATGRYQAMKEMGAYQMSSVDEVTGGGAVRGVGDSSNGAGSTVESITREVDNGMNGSGAVLGSSGSGQSASYQSA